MKWIAPIINGFNIYDSKIRSFNETYPNAVYVNWVFIPAWAFLTKLFEFITTSLYLSFSQLEIYGPDISDKQHVLKPREYCIYSLGLYSLVGGKFVNLQWLNQIDNTTYKSVMTVGVTAIALVVFVLIFAFIIYSSIIVAKARLPFSFAFKVAAYAFGAIAPIGFLTLLFVLAANFLLQSFQPVYFQAISVILIVISTFWMLHISNIKPIKVKNDSCSYFRLYLGWFLGWFAVQVIFFTVVFASGSL
jgi:hypothetical protein